MQFPPSSFSSDANLAALLLGGVAPAGNATAQSPATGGAATAAFDQVFASLASPAVPTAPTGASAAMSGGSVLMPGNVGLLPTQIAGAGLPGATETGTTSSSGQVTTDAVPDVLTNEVVGSSSEEPEVNPIFCQVRRPSENRGVTRKGAPSGEKGGDNDGAGEQNLRVHAQILPLDMLMPFVEAPVAFGPRFATDTSDISSLEGQFASETFPESESEESSEEPGFDATLPSIFGGAKKAPVQPGTGPQLAPAPDALDTVDPVKRGVPQTLNPVDPSERGAASTRLGLARGGDAIYQSARTIVPALSTQEGDSQEGISPFAGTSWAEENGNAAAAPSLPIRPTRVSTNASNALPSTAWSVAPTRSASVSILSEVTETVKPESVLQRADTAVAPAPQEAAAQLEVATREGAPVLPGLELHRSDLAARRAPAAKIAAGTSEISPTTGSRNSERVKTFLSAGSKRVAEQEPFLGTGVAKAEATMSVTSFLDRSTAAGATPSESLAITGSEGLDAALRETDFANEAGALTSPETAQAARRAVEAVLTTVDRVASREQSAVKLEFSVGDEQLAVRVELHANEIRATFTTDSHELRSALAHEWQAMTLGAERTVRVSPVFEATPNGQGGAQNFSGDTSSQSQQRHGGARSGEPAQSFSSFAPSAEADRSATAAGSAPRTVSSTARHLHTLA